MTMMKRQLLILAFMLGLATPVMAQQTDPTLTAAVATQTDILRKIFKTRDKTQKEIIGSEVAVTLAMERMHSLEKKMLEYLQNAQASCRTSIRSSVRRSSWVWRYLRTWHC